MSEQLPSDDLIARLRKRVATAFKSGSNLSMRPEDLLTLIERVEQLQMPHAEVIRLAEVSDDGADSAALMKALCAKVEAQRRRIAQMERDHRDDMRSAAAEERRSITTGEPYGTY